MGLKETRETQRGRHWRTFVCLIDLFALVLPSYRSFVCKLRFCFWWICLFCLSAHSLACMSIWLLLSSSLFLLVCLLVLVRLVCFVVYCCCFVSHRYCCCCCCFVVDVFVVLAAGVVCQFFLFSLLATWIDFVLFMLFRLFDISLQI